MKLADRNTEAGDFSTGFETHNFPSSDFETNSSFMSNAEESLNMSQLGVDKNSEGGNDDDQDDEPRSLSLVDCLSQNHTEATTKSKLGN